MENIICNFIDRETLSHHIGKIIKKLRKNQNIKQENLSLQCMISRNTISLIERGKICPTFDTIYRICTVLEISISDFISLVETSIQNSTL